jgi:ribosomal protein S2
MMTNFKSIKTLKKLSKMEKKNVISTTEDRHKSKSFS